ncbi:MAG: tRNA lysidine(34) synthetase TilS [Bacteroidales bacterium]|nr:tRNA lysidine(34) synthetase TilS [Bacteroidales bacterium]
MCLADLWLRCFGAGSFAIAHCNFHLRGKESDGDEALVTKWAEENGVRMHRVDFDTVSYASENGLSIEMAARELRYRWFGELCQKHGYEAVVVAHHADDNAETLVLNMVRGAGLKGLTGMKPVSPLPYLSRHCEERSDVAILRPLLTFTRKQIEGHVFAWKVPYREDSTNSSVEYRRNSIRHEVFPLFERMNPSYVRTLNREMTYLSDASSIVEEWCRMQLSAVIDPHVGTSSLLRMTPEGPHTSLRGFEEAVAISIPRLLEIPQWRYLLYYILEPYGFNASALESLENLLMSDRTISGKRFESSGYVLRTERQSLVVVPKMAGHAGHDVPGHPARDVAVIPDLIGDPFVPVRGAGAYHCNGRRFVVEVLPWSAEMPLQQPAGTLIFDADKLKFPFVCRGWRNGDWMIPLGMKGKKKLSDMFTDLKYSYQDKENALVLVDCIGDRAEKQHVAALLGVRIDDHYKVSDRTTSIIRITL